MKNQNKLLWVLPGWLLLLGLLLAVDARAESRTDYAQRIGASLGLGFVSVTWHAHESMQREFGKRGYVVYGNTNCRAYKSAADGSVYAVCEIDVSKAGKPNGGWRDTVRHEFCHVYAMVASVSKIDTAATPEQIDASIREDGQHEDNAAFMKCARVLTISLDLSH